MSPELSIVVCTRNRARSLERCLAAIAGLDRSFAFETIVVDNASEDETAPMVSRLVGADQDLRHVIEPQLGLSHARNRGAEEARAPLLAYLDDDTTPTPGWAEALRGAFAETDAQVVGGPILPRFEVPPPPAIHRVQFGAWSCQDLGSARRTVTEFPYLLGANLAVRRDHLERLGGFDETLGRKGVSLLSGEDTDLCERTLAVNASLVYEPSAVAHHWIAAERLSQSYLRRRALGTGRTRAIQMARRLGAPAIAASLLVKVTKLPAHLALWGLARALGREGTAAERAWSVYATLGTLGHFLDGEREER